MGIKKITELTEATSVDGTELVPFVQNGVTKKATLATIVSDIQTGPQGPAGPTGEAGPVGPAGENGSSFNWVGQWSSASGYLIDDVVQYAGSAFIAVEVSNNQPPTGGIYWDLLISKGDTGSAGAAGPGVASGGIAGQYLKKNSGTDYDTAWTTLSLVNSDISSTAQIAYSKLNLTGGIVNADVSSGAAIAYSKLNLTGGIVNADVSSGAAIAYSKLNLAGAVTNADISSAASAAIAWTKVSKTGSSLADLATRSASDIATGTLADARLSSNVPLKNAANQFTNHNVINATTITYSGTMTWVASTGQVAQVTLSGNPTLTANSFLNGGFYSLLIIQDGTGGYTISWDTNVFKFTGGVAPTLSTAAGAQDVITFRSNGTELLEVGRSLGVS